MAAGIGTAASGGGSLTITPYPFPNVSQPHVVVLFYFIEMNVHFPYVFLTKAELAGVSFQR